MKWSLAFSCLLSVPVIQAASGLDSWCAQTVQLFQQCQELHTDNPDTTHFGMMQWFPLLGHHRNLGPIHSTALSCPSEPDESSKGLGGWPIRVKLGAGDPWQLDCKQGSRWIGKTDWRRREGLHSQNIERNGCKIGKASWTKFFGKWIN